MHQTLRADRRTRALVKSRFRLDDGSDERRIDVVLPRLRVNQSAERDRVVEKVVTNHRVDSRHLGMKQIELRRRCGGNRQPFLIE